MIQPKFVFSNPLMLPFIKFTNIYQMFHLSEINDEYSNDILEMIFA